MPHAAFTVDEHPWREPIHSTPGVLPSPSTNETPDADAGSPLTRSCYCWTESTCEAPFVPPFPVRRTTDPNALLRFCHLALATTSRARDTRLHPRRTPAATWQPSRKSFRLALAGEASLSSHERLGALRPSAGGARRRCVPTSHVTAWAAGRRRVTQRLSSSLRGTVGCGDIRRPSVITLLDRRTLSGEQPREGLPAPRARGAIHRVTERDCPLGWRGFDLSRGRGRRCSDRAPCPSAWGCLCFLRGPVIRTRCAGV